MLSSKFAPAITAALPSAQSRQDDKMVMTMRPLTEVDGKLMATEAVLSDPLLHRRLVRTQIEEMLAFHRHYPLREFQEVWRALTQMQQAYSDVEPFDRPLLAVMDASEE